MHFSPLKVSETGSNPHTCEEDKERVTRNGRRGGSAILRSDKTRTWEANGDCHPPWAPIQAGSWCRTCNSRMLHPDTLSLPGWCLDSGFSITIYLNTVPIVNSSVFRVRRSSCTRNRQLGICGHLRRTCGWHSQAPQSLVGPFKHSVTLGSSTKASIRVAPPGNTDKHIVPVHDHVVEIEPSSRSTTSLRSQTEQADDPVAEEVPLGHSKHVETEVAPGTDEALPAMHKEHDEASLLLE